MLHAGLAQRHMDVSRTELRDVASTSACRVWAERGIAVARFWNETTPQEIEALQSGIAAAGEHGDRVAIMVVVDASANPPDRETRSRLAEVLGEVSHRALAFAGVVLGQGLKATSKRTMMRLVLSFAGLRAPCQVFADPEDAASWLARMLTDAHDSPYPPNVLLATIEQGVDPASQG